MLSERVKETTTTTGTGSITLGGAVTGFRTFSAAFGASALVYYVIEGGSEWEVGFGTQTTGILTRTTVIASSNAGSLVNFSAGTKIVYCDVPSHFLLPRWTAYSSGATITFNLANQGVHAVTLGQNATLAISNVPATIGQQFKVRLQQDATGGRTVTWWSNIKWTVPTLSSGANKVDWFEFIVTGTSGTYDGFTIAQNM